MPTSSDVYCSWQALKPYHTWIGMLGRPIEVREACKLLMKTYKVSADPEHMKILLDPRRSATGRLGRYSIRGYGTLVTNERKTPAGWLGWTGDRLRNLISHIFVRNQIVYRRVNARGHQTRAPFRNVQRRQARRCSDCHG